MAKLSKILKEYFYAWGDDDPEKKVLRYGKFITLRRLHEYDDYKYYRPRRNAAKSIFIATGGYALFRGGKYLKDRFDGKRNGRGKD